jgi:tricorn protease
MSDFPSKRNRPWIVAGCLAFLLGWSIAGRAEEARLLRFPAIYGEQIVFTYAGDLYNVPSAGGVARKLTSDAGFEMFARFSPDGKWLAFTGQYDGNTEVYLMPAAGGVPKRLTYTANLDRDDVSDRMGPNNIVLTWRDEKTIVFRSRAASWNDFVGQLYLVSIDGGLPEQLPLPRGGWCCYSPDKRQLAYNRIFREFRTWKRYRGGQADDIWIYDFAAKTTTNITCNPASDLFPMWQGERIYFLSDRDENKRMNLFCYDLKTKATRQLTRFKDYDVKFPSLGPGAIVFENGGYLYRFDLKTEGAAKVPVYIHEDLAGGRGGWRDVSKEITSYEIAPDGSRALVGARGDVFTVPAKYGNTRNLTQTSGVHERNAVWSPDGKWIAYVGDATGEDEIYIMPQDGSEGAAQLTRGGDTYKYHLAWSPDGKRLLWSDKKQRLQCVDVQSRVVTLVAQATAWEISHYQWSPDGQWIVYVKPEARQMPKIYLFSPAAKRAWPVTDGWFASGEPAFSADGKYLFFVSQRSYHPRESHVEKNFAYFDMEKIFFVTLAKETKSLFAPKSDEVEMSKEEKAGKPPAEGYKKVTVKVDVDGLGDRIGVLPVAPSSYDRLTSIGQRLYYCRQGLTDPKAKLLVYDFEKRKETELGEVAGYKISADGKKMLVRADGSLAIVDLPADKLEIKEHLDLGNMKVALDRREEWKQIYGECWRQMRDFVYAPNMQGVDWPKIRALYEPLLSSVNHRADLTYVIGEMIGELNLGHAYVGGGDYPRPHRIPTGLLGARIQRDGGSGYFRIQRILKGQNWDPRLRSPLTEIGVNVKEGDYILAVDGKPADRMPNLYAALVDTVEKQVTLRVNSRPEVKGSRQTVVVPIGDERPLYYLNWVLRNIERVSQATGGKVAYVHVPNMMSEGLNEFAKFYYPQTHKEGLIVDVRGNAGGNVSPEIIERLRRQLAMITVARNAAIDTDPTGMILGPKVMLLDEFSASDGDIVADRFQHYKLGPVVGKRSWGGVVGIRESLPLLDGGYLFRPEFSRYDVEGKRWIIEGHGVEPDIVVDNDPAREFAGIDDQLERAIEVIKRALNEHPVRLPSPPPYPDKSK